MRGLRWFRRPGGQFFHTINAWNEGETIHLDLCVSQMNSFPFIPDVSGEPYDPGKVLDPALPLDADLTRNDDQIDERIISSIPGDVPRIDDRRIAPMLSPKLHGHGRPDAGDAAFRSGRRRLQHGRAPGHGDRADRRWYGEDDDSFQEPQFIPTGPGELDGYVVR